jgi:hypothetical protein
MASSYLKFVLSQRPEEKKTDIWEITSIQSGETLGEIRWWGSWRKYVFVPNNGSIFDIGCMKEIIEFINQEMLARKTQSNQQKQK